ncbi:hypothetical protein M8C21_001710, partial [Ambrosia artemisiifolia]
MASIKVLVALLFIIAIVGNLSIAGATKDVVQPQYDCKAYWTIHPCDTSVCNSQCHAMYPSSGHGYCTPG